MTPAEIYYEAACVMSDMQSERGDYSCHVVNQVEMGETTIEPGPVESKYFDLMNNLDPLVMLDAAVLDAACSVNWIARDFRTFMLLMASEAVK